MAIPMNKNVEPVMIWQTTSNMRLERRSASVPANGEHEEHREVRSRALPSRPARLLLGNFERNNVLRRHVHRDAAEVEQGSQPQDSDGGGP